ncbi:MAG: zinc ribbon domain-containing protein [Desulfobacterales bacterium]|nr:zinc ribbon domain-containing protein [Desulfobacterales bacterium]
MPIYEFYCEACNTIFNFFSKSVNTDKTPGCPKCPNKALSRQMSAFAVTGRAREDEVMDDIPFDESKMEKAMEALAGEAENINEDDPRQAAQLMRKLTDITGMQMGSGMEEALDRMEKGEDPETIEAEMGELLDGEDPFIIPAKQSASAPGKRRAPIKDETLYDL